MFHVCDLDFILVVGSSMPAPCLVGHQFHRPSNTTVEGTNKVLTRKVSMIMPRARPVPISLIWLDELPPTIARTVNVPARTRPADVTVVPVVVSACDTAFLKGRA